MIFLRWVCMFIVLPPLNRDFFVHFIRSVPFSCVMCCTLSLSFCLTLTFSLPPSICSLPYLCPSHLVFLHLHFVAWSSLWFGFISFKVLAPWTLFLMVLSVTSLFLFHSLIYSTFYIVLSPSSSHICMNDVCISSIRSRNGCKKTKERRGTRGLCGERGCYSHMLSVTLLFVLPRTVPKLDFCFHVVDLIGQSLAAAVSSLSSKLWWVTHDSTHYWS